MRVSPCYLAAVSDLARDSESGIFPCFELENQASAIGARFGVCDADVQSDVSAAIDRHTAAQPVSPRFVFTDEAGKLREIPTHDDDFFRLCIGGVRIGGPVKTPQDAQALIDAHLSDGVEPVLLTVEAYRQGANDGAPVRATPFYERGHWVAEHRVPA